MFIWVNLRLYKTLYRSVLKVLGGGQGFPFGFGGGEGVRGGGVGGL